MLIRGVDLPGTLLEAQENGSLVVFAGAGVSMPPPSNYPNFDKLAEDVAQGALVRERAPGSSEYREPVDRFLGRLVKHGIPVHEIVRRILSDPTSKPNPLHANLLRLFGSAGAIKVITTNFDPHFTSAANLVFKDAFESYFAPALPLGDGFSGLVYLHGSVDKPAERLVLTDADFGRAYLTEGWARRFLQRLFSRYIVLFVGYSHSDPVMNYLARGLPPESDRPRRFALAREDDFERWTFLGVKPIAYPNGTGDNRHSAVGAVCAAWADMAERGVLDQEQKIKEIVELPVSLDPEDLDYVLESLRKESTTRFFTRYARRPDWLRWLESKDYLKRLFLPGSATNATDGELASWFAENFVCEHLDDALAVVLRNGQFLNARLWHSIVLQLFRKKDPPPPPEIFGRWVPILLNSVPPGGSHLLDYILRRLGSPENAPTAVLLFNHLTKLRIVLKKDIWFETIESENERVGIEVTAEGGDYWLRENWHSVFVPRLDYFADPLLWIVTSNLQHGHQMLQCFDKVHERWDQLNSHRM
jgi:hypothetical protein